jgi:hypothetical protein
MKFLKPIRDNCGERFVTHFAVILAYSVGNIYSNTSLSDSDCISLSYQP